MHGVACPPEPVISCAWCCMPTMHGQSWGVTIVQVTCLSVSIVLCVRMHCSACFDPACIYGTWSACTAQHTLTLHDHMAPCPGISVPPMHRAANGYTQVIVGLRNGALLQLTSSSLGSTPSLPPSAPQLQLVTVKKVGSLPVVVVPLPTAAGLVGTSLAVSDRLALLHMAPGPGRLVATALAVAGVLHAVPLWQSVPAPADSTNPR